METVRRVPYEADGWGVGELWIREGRLVYHELPGRRAEPELAPPRGAQRAPSGTLAEPATRDCVDFVSDLVRRLRAYFGGQRPAFSDVQLDLEWCTPFQLAVADALREVPYGDVVTYGELAALAGRPNAQRAAGTFCAGNRFPLLLPCHRVVSAAGIGSYGSLGVGYKRRLLRLEGVAL